MGREVMHALKFKRTNLLKVTLIAVVALLATCLLALVVRVEPSQAAFAGEASTTCGPSWVTVPSSAEVRDPRAIAPIASNDIWIVGNRARSGTSRSTAAEHWDGSSWALVPTPNVERESILTGADALSTNAVWAVGYTSGGPKSNTLIERWNGSQWTVVSSPNPSGVANALTGVDALGSKLAWAVGYYRIGTLRKTLIQRWDGTSWGVVSSPSPGTHSNALLDLKAIGANNIWAVGYRSSGAGYRSLVLRYNGTTWTNVAVPAFGTGDNILTSISADTTNDIWAAGYYVDGTQHKTLTLQYDGTSWTRIPSANDGDGISILQGTDASSSTNAWAVGFKYRASLGDYVAATQHWNGSAWSSVPSATAQTNTKSEMFDVAKVPNTSQLWASGRPADVETFCPSGTLSTTVSSESVNEYSPSSANITDRPVKHMNLTAAEALVSAEQEENMSSTAMTVSAVDKALSSGISETTKTYGAIISDFNNDGLKDIFLGRHDRAARLYINDGGGAFTEINQGTFPAPRDRHGCDAADVNNDGLKDIFCAVGALAGTQAKRNELYVQQPDHTFVDKTQQYGVFEPFARGMFGTFIRANGDVYPDLYVANQRDRLDGMPSPNRLFVNSSGSKYRYAPGFGLERELGGGATTGGSADVGDLDKDGWQDFVTEASGFRVYHNNQGNGFTDVTASVGLGQDATDATLADVNGDTWLDVIKVTPDNLRVLLNTNGTFSSVFSASLQSGLAVAAGDVNGDNRPDIYVMRGQDAGGANAADQVYLNDGTGKNFTQHSSIPSTNQGAAESVWPIDYDSNGLTDFLVLNGEEDTAGPVQLIAFFPAS
jgi:hypothetical protein